MKTRILLTGILMPVMLLAIGATPGEPDVEPFKRAQLLPVDAASGNAELLETREALREAVKNRNAEALLKHVNADIKCSFGAESGKDDFIKMWALNEEPEKSPIWVELGEVLRLGGTWESGPDNSPTFVAPYVFGQWPEDLDPMEFGAIVGDNVNLRAGPGLKYWIVTQADYLIVRLLPDNEMKSETLGGETFPWQKVGLPDGQIAYVWGKYVRSPIGYRAGFRLIDGRWQMVSFLAGD